MIMPTPMPMIINSGGGGNGTEYEYPFFVELITSLGMLLTVGGMVGFVACLIISFITDEKYFDFDGKPTKIALVVVGIGAIMLLIGIILMALTGRKVNE